MNYLAHLYLSATNKEIMLGNFIADRVKGNQYLNYPPEVQQGILLHRSIDSFTDEHRVSKLIKKELFPAHRHYSAVLVDMFYDHFLAKNWQQYSTKTLPEYANYCYEVLIDFKEYLPDSSLRYLTAMKQYRWLESYETIEGLENVLHLMSQRTKFPTQLDESVWILKNQYAYFESLFFEFFPTIEDHVNQKIIKYA
jgi:acyl carrier protein phosphodiesterase